MRIRGVRISRAYNFAQQNKRRIGEFVFFQYRIKRYVFAMMPELAVRNVENDAILDSCPLGIVRQENKLRACIDEFPDEPRACDPIYFNFLASDPFHKLES